MPMLPLMQKNIALNGLEGRVVAKVHDWGEIQQLESLAKPDVALAADCVYFEPSFPLLLLSLEALVVGKTVCYFSFKKRRKADMRFIKALRKSFDIEEVKDNPDKDQNDRASIYMCVQRIGREKIC
jgi:protein N-lysine methyltransferase METTL21A